MTFYDKLTYNDKQYQVRDRMKQKKLTSIEVCAGAGGQALGLEMAGFEHVALIDNDKQSCETLRFNRPDWNVIEEDLNNFDGTPYKGVDLVAGGVPCPPFSHAGKQLGSLDDRDLFPAALRLVAQVQPKAVLLENVRGLLDPKFAEYRENIINQLRELGYTADWHLIQAARHGVPQLRPRAILVALKHEYWDSFEWPDVEAKKITVGEALYEQMASNGWKGAKAWKKQANAIGPTLVGGSKKHGGADLGPTRAKAAWAQLGVDGRGVADEAPAPDFVGMPRLTVEMAATIQGFPKSWKITGRKTSAYRQVGNAFPPPVAQAVGLAIYQALTTASQAVAVTDDDDITLTQASVVAQAA